MTFFFSRSFLLILLIEFFLGLTQKAQTKKKKKQLFLFAINVKKEAKRTKNNKSKEDGAARTRVCR
jgi:hypothetical protein